MNIILNETEWAEEMLSSRSLGERPVETISCIARYLYGVGYKKNDVERRLRDFYAECDPNIPQRDLDGKIDLALKAARKRPPVDIGFVEITDAEMSSIGLLGGVRIRRLAFTLLCLSKYLDVKNQNNSHWVNMKDSHIMKLACVNTSVQQQCEMYRRLFELGYLTPSKKIDNTNVRVEFIADGDVAVQVSDFRNLGNQYMIASGDNNYIKCKNCGVVVRKNKKQPEYISKRTGSQKYCKECAAKIAVQQRVDSVMRMRKSGKDIFEKVENTNEGNPLQDN